MVDKAKKEESLSNGWFKKEQEMDDCKDVNGIQDFVLKSMRERT